MSNFFLETKCFPSPAVPTRLPCRACLHRVHKYNHDGQATGANANSSSKSLDRRSGNCAPLGEVGIMKIFSQPRDSPRCPINDHIMIIIIISSRSKDVRLPDQSFHTLTAPVCGTKGQSSKHDARQPRTPNSANPRQCLADCIVTPIFFFYISNIEGRRLAQMRCSGNGGPCGPF